MTKQTGEEAKLLIVKQILQQKETIYSIAKQFNLSKETVRRWVRNYQLNGTVKRKEGERESYKVTQEHVDFAKNYLTKHPTVTMPDLVNIMRDKFEDFDITPQWLGHVLRDNNLTRKKVRKYHSPYFRYTPKPI